MFRTWLVVFAAAAALVLVVPAATANNATGPPTTGTQINIAAAPATFPADTPFYVRHGFISLADTNTSNWGQFMSDPATKGVMSGLTHFDLYVDGRRMQSITDLSFTDFVSKAGLTNFRNGLPAGAHTFVGEWYDNGELALTRTAVVTFT